MGQAHGALHLGRRRLRVRAEDRRPRHVAALRGRPLRAGGHPGQRRDGRGRHRERPHHRRRPRAARAPRRRAAPACWRCGARSTCRCRPSRSSTSARARPGCACSPTPATRAPARCARRTPRSRPAATCGSWLPAGRGGGRADVPPPLRDARVPRRRRPAGQPRDPDARRPGGRLRVLPALARPPPRPRLRDRRRGGEGRRPGPAGRAGVHVEVAPVGHRLQVPPRGGHHHAQGHHGVDRAAPGRPPRSPCSSRCG